MIRNRNAVTDEKLINIALVTIFIAMTLFILSLVFYFMFGNHVIGIVFIIGASIFAFISAIYGMFAVKYKEERERLWENNEVKVKTWKHK